MSFIPQRISVGTVSSVTGISGSGTSGQVAYFSGATQLSSQNTFTFNGTDITMTCPTANPLIIKALSGNSNGLRVYCNTATDDATIVNFYNANLEIGTNNVIYQTITAAGVTTFGGNTIARKDQNAVTLLQVRNDNAGASAAARLAVTSDQGDLNLYANSAAAGDSVSLTADSTFGGGMDIGILGANTLRLNTAGATRISASGAGLVTIGTAAGNEEHVANGRLSIIPQTNLPLKLTGNSSAGTITFANPAASGKYNWLIGGQYNINNAFEITPSTAVDGSTFSTPVVTITNNGLVSFTNNVTVTSSGGPQYVAKDGGSFGTNADPHIQFEDTTGSGGRIGFTDGASKDLKIQNQTDTGLFDFVTVATQIAGSAGAATGTYWTIKLGGTTYKLALLANA